MTDYFDQLSSKLASETRVDNETGFINSATSMERMKLVPTVTLLCGDREFPDDLRQRIMAAIAVDGLYPGTNALDPLPRTVQKAKALRQSILLGTLHNLFHELAERRIETRFGLLTDDPADCLKARDHHDTEHYRQFQTEQQE